MTDDDIYWIAGVAVHFDALLFVWRQRNGVQVVLFPRFWDGRATPIYQA
jgi:hypothetical protein